MEEMPLRGWLLLQHLAQWQQWNDLSGNPFSNKVDMERIALIGHSRGGEAVVWAALPAYLVKASWLTGLHGFPGKMTPEEIVLQTHTLPLAAFQTVSPTINLSNLQTIRFLFDGTTTGAIYLDKIGFSEQTR